MGDTLSEIIALMRPRAVFSKRISGAGRWGVRYSAFGHPSFCAVLEGRCKLAVEGDRERVIEAGDFVLLPATPSFVMCGFEPCRPQRLDPNATAGNAGEVRHHVRLARRRAPGVALARGDPRPR
jgi:hypothetical protein